MVTLDQLRTPWLQYAIWQCTEMLMTSGKLGTGAYAYTTLQVVWWFLQIYADNTGRFVLQWTKDLS
jgi:hypothetical protein